MTFTRTSERRLTAPLPVTIADSYFYPPQSGWTWVNQGAASVKAENRGHIWTQPAVGANNLIGRFRAYTNPVTVTALLNNVTSPAGFGGHGLGFRSATGQVVICYWSAGSSQWNVENWASPTSFTSTVGAMSSLIGRNGGWLQVEDNGTSLLFRASATGRTGSFITGPTVGRTAFLTGGPTSVGWWGRDNNGIQSWIMERWDQ